MRYRMMVGMLTAGALAAPTTGLLAAVQEPERDEVREFRFESGGPEHLMRIVLDRRARLGIKVNLQKRETDSVGAYVESVTPSGPAAKAGIRSGDIITKLDGKSVLSGGSAEERDGRQSPPGLRLIELAARLEPGECPRCGYLGWAPATDLSETIRRTLRQFPLERRRRIAH